MASIEERRGELLAAAADSVAARRGMDAWLRGAGPMPDAQALSGFARALNESAEAFACREARLAGHSPVFEALRDWLLSEPSPEQMALLAAPLGVSAAALRLSLQRLRRRVRQRIDSNLALWAPDAETRQTLRHRLRAALTGNEEQP